jgi:hypothetical protein
MSISRQAYVVVVVAVAVGMIASVGLVTSTNIATGADSPYDGKGISFVAFCHDSGFTAGDVTELDFDDQTDAQVVYYTLSKEPDSIVIKAAQTYTQFDDSTDPSVGTTGYVVSDADNGTDVSSGASTTNVCPAGQTGVKVDLTGSPAYPDAGAFDQVGARS